MMDSLPMISLITPSYNQGRLIERTIRSVLEQKYPNLDYWIIDGGSTDETLSVLETYRSDLVHWISEHDNGQANAINKGFQKTSGEIVGYLNSDDELEPGSLLAVGKYFTTHPEANWVSGYCRFIDLRGREIRKTITRYKNFWLREHSYTTLLILNYISQPATFWTRRIMERVGSLDESLQYTMDYDYWLRIGKVTHLWTIRKYLARFRIHLSSKTGLPNPLQFREDAKIARRHTTSPYLVLLHRLHNRLILATYRGLSISQLRGEVNE